MIRLALLCAVGVLTVFATSPAQAAFPGEPGPIAYSKTSTDETGEGTLLRVGGIFAGRAQRPHLPRPLTMSPNDHSPSYSADGRSIVFVSESETGHVGIFTMPSDGSERKLVISDGADPHFFPSGGAIAFARTVEGHSHIFTIRLDGSGLRQLTSGPYDDYDPAVSPDGRRIVFISNRDRDSRRDRTDLFAIGAQGGGLQILSDLRRTQAEPDWSPNGRRIVFSMRTGSYSNIFVVRTGGSRLWALTACKARPRCRDYVSPAFSPGGRHVVALGLGTRTSTISLLPVDGHGATDSIDSGGTGEEGFGSHVGAPAWGPAEPGRRISVSSVARVQSTPRSLRP